jgi:hypothetical protein
MKSLDRTLNLAKTLYLNSLISRVDRATKKVDVVNRLDKLKSRLDELRDAGAFDDDWLSELAKAVQGRESVQELMQKVMRKPRQKPPEEYPRGLPAPAKLDAVLEAISEADETIKNMFPSTYEQPTNPNALMSDPQLMQKLRGIAG